MAGDDVHSKSRLGDLVVFINGDRGENYPSPSDYVTEGVPFVSAADIMDGRVVWSGTKRITEDKYASLRGGRIEAGDLLFCLRGSLGKIARIRKVDRAAIASSLVIIRPKPGVDRNYIYYVLSSSFGQRLAADLDNGSVQPNISVRSLQMSEVPTPPLNEQRAIAHILGTLDDKIELNRRMNETLEAIARAIFKSWFVGFDPVRAKASGEAPESICRRLGLTPDLLALFPDRLVDSELGEIPEGWFKGTVDEEFDLTMGQSPPGNTYNEAGEGLPFYQGRTDFGFRFPSRRVFCTAPTRFAETGDTLVSVRAPVGDINMAEEQCCIGRGVAAARHKSGSRSYTYYFMQSIEEVFKQFEAEGTVFGSISKKDFHNIERTMPPSEIVHAFEQLVSPIDDQIASISKQSKTLAELRDALLPKLLSGELSVQPTETLV